MQASNAYGKGYVNMWMKKLYKYSQGNKAKLNTYHYR